MTILAIAVGMIIAMFATIIGIFIGVALAERGQERSNGRIDWN